MQRDEWRNGSPPRPPLPCRKRDVVSGKDGGGEDEGVPDMGSMTDDGERSRQESAHLCAGVMLVEEPQWEGRSDGRDPLREHRGRLPTNRVGTREVDMGGMDGTWRS